MKLPLVAAFMVGVMLLSCASEQGVTVDTLLETQRIHLETVLEADNELQLDVQRAFIAWEIVLAQDRTIDWTTEELIAELERAYLVKNHWKPSALGLTQRSTQASKVWCWRELSRAARRWATAAEESCTTGKMRKN